MIKVKVNNEYKDVVKIFCGGTLQKEIVKVWSREAQEYVYESSVEYTGSLPITINANGDALLDYRIYGADGGVGVATENLFVINNLYSTITIQGQTFTKPKSAYFFDIFSGTSGGSTPMNLQKSIPVTSGTYTLSFEESETRISVVFSDGGTQTIIAGSSSVTTRTFDVSSDGYISIRCEDAEVCSVKKLQIVKASTAPTNYIPYGYKLPMTVSDGDTVQTVPVYIGENQLDAISEYSDYVDYGTQKIIRRIAKVELDGSEDWHTYLNSVYVGVPNYIKSVWGTCAGFSRSSHYAPSLEAAEIGTYCLGGLVQYRNTRWNGNIVINAGMTVTEYRAYLASQVAAGTPVTFWYVVEIPVEQEPSVPLPEIPTIDGTTIIDYDEEPKPSQMYVKYRR